MAFHNGMMMRVADRRGDYGGSLNRQVRPVAGPATLSKVLTDAQLKMICDAIQESENGIAIKTAATLINSTRYRLRQYLLETGASSLFFLGETKVSASDGSPSRKFYPLLMRSSK